LAVESVLVDFLEIVLDRWIVPEEQGFLVAHRIGQVSTKDTNFRVCFAVKGTQAVVSREKPRETNSFQRAFYGEESVIGNAGTSKGKGIFFRKGKVYRKNPVRRICRVQGRREDGKDRDSIPLDKLPERSFARGFAAENSPLGHVSISWRHGDGE